MTSISGADPMVQMAMNVMQQTMGSTKPATSLASRAYQNGQGRTSGGQFLNSLLTTSTGNTNGSQARGLRSSEAAVLQGAGDLMKSLATQMQGNGRFQSVSNQQTSGTQSGNGGVGDDVLELLSSLSTLLAAANMQSQGNGNLDSLSDAGDTDALADSDDTDDTDDTDGLDSDSGSLLQLPTIQGSGSGRGNQQGVTTHDQALKVIDRNFDNGKLGDGKKFTQADLKKAAADGKNPKLAAAAQYALDNGMFNDQNGKPLKSVSKNNLRAELQTTGNAAGDEAVEQTLGKYRTSLFGKNGKGSLSKADVASMAKGGKMPDGQATPADLQLACKNLQSKPELMDKLDAAYLDSKGKPNAKNASDGKFTAADLDITSNESRRGPGETARTTSLSGINLGPGSAVSSRQNTKGQAFTNMLMSAMLNHSKATGNTVNINVNEFIKNQQPAVF